MSILISIPVIAELYLRLFAAIQWEAHPLLLAEKLKTL